VVSPSLAAATTSTARAHAAAAPTGAGGFGLAGDLEWLTGSALNAELDRYRTLGVQYARFQLVWGAVQRHGRTSFDWAPIDALVAGLVARGIQPIAVIGTTPSWASRAGGCTALICAPTNPAQFAAFARAAAARYSRRGLHVWEIWNEPNNYLFWAPRPDVASYTAVLRASYQAIKGVDRRATVITGGVAPAVTSPGWIAPLDFLAGIYAHHGHGFFDGVGWHPFTYPRLPGTVNSGDAWYQMYGPRHSARAQMAAHGDAAKRIWATEFGAHTDPAGFGYVSEARQAQMIALAARLWVRVPWAGPLVIFQLHDLGTGTANRENFFGLQRLDGTPKPAWTVFRAAIVAYRQRQPTG